MKTELTLQSNRLPTVLLVHDDRANLATLTVLLAGLTGFCGLALVLAKMPWNQTSARHSAACCTPDSK